MPDKPKVDLGDYTEVKDRIALFYERYAQGRLVTEEVRATREPDDVPRIWVKAAAYRSPDDPHPAVGWSWMVLPGSTNFTRGSELENTETSAWGRAIGSLGILIERSIATSNEIESKAQPVAPRPAPVARDSTAPATARLSTNEPPEVTNDELDSLVASQTAILRPPAPAGVPQCPVHNWDMRPDKRPGHAGEFSCTGKTNGQWCSERAR
jgi:hypothetical protein